MSEIEPVAGPHSHTRRAERPAADTHERPGRITLRALGGPQAGQEFCVAVRADGLVFGGRAIGNDICLADELVSGCHFSLQVDPNGLVLRDLGSTNGVFFHEVRVREVVLPMGAIFRVGDTILRLAGTAPVRVHLSPHDHFGALYGWSPVMRELFFILERASASPSSRLPVLVTGETGTGKELVARGLHDSSVRADGPFIVLDCTAIPPELADAIVFGHARGAFSGAVSEHAGVFEMADGGTLFIDELGELPLAVQAKLLRVLDRREVTRFNEQNRVRRVDVRVVCATHRDLPRMVDEGRFREDLFFRLHGRHIRLPSLRERDDDAVLLAERFVAAASAELGLPVRRLSAAACAAIRRAPWPGNVRELQLVIASAVEFAEGRVIDVDDLRLDRAAPRVEASLDVSWDRAQVDFQRRYLLHLIRRVGHERGWIKQAAELAGMDRGGLVKALKRHGLYRTAMETSE